MPRIDRMSRISRKLNSQSTSVLIDRISSQIIGPYLSQCGGRVRM